MGQEDYPLYLSAPYRLLSVLAGSFIAYVWTVFPYPITDRGLLGDKLGDMLSLLAQFQDCGHSNASLKLRGPVKDDDMMALDFSPLWQELRADSLPPSALTGDVEAVQRAWAMMQMVTDISNVALMRIIMHARDLVGEVNFDMEGR